MKKLNRDENHLARELTLKILFTQEFSTVSTPKDWPLLFEIEIPSFISEKIENYLDGISAHQSEIDKTISSFAKNWRIERMSFVDKNVLRLAVYEMIYDSPQLAPPIAINEAIDLAKLYGSTDSGSFVNGILDQIAKSKGYQKP